MKSFNGKALFLDRSDINTDEIIPAKYLTELTKEALKPYLLEDLKLEGFDPKRDLEGVKIIITRENFGCGSSREHAPWALEMNAVNLVIAPSFARIFRQNMYNCGMMAVELAPEIIDELFTSFAACPEVQITTEWDKKIFILRAGKETRTLPFRLSPFDRDLVEAGGWVNYADSRY